jgi:S1-C subfamily serine protease
MFPRPEIPMTRPLALALAVGLFALPVAAEDPLSMSDATKEKVKRATAMVCDKAGGHGTGFLVLPNVLATNAHVIGTRPADEFEAKFVEDNGKVKAYPLQLLAIDGARDLALLRVKDDTFARVPLDVRTDLKAGDKSVLGVLGNPGQWGNGWAVVNSLTQATLTKELMAKDGLPFYELEVRDAVERKLQARPQEADGAELLARMPGDKIKTGPGNSGGPVLDSAGRAVGVLTRAEMELDDTPTGTPTGLFQAVPGTDLKRMIDGLGKPDGWDAAGRVAAVRHAQNVARLYLWAEVEAAAKVLDARNLLWNIAHNEKKAGVRLKRDPRLIDGECMKAYTATSESFRKSQQAVTVVALRVAKGDESKALKEQLAALERITNRHSNLFGSTHKSTTDPDVKTKEYHACIKELEKYRKLIREEALKAGWDEDHARQLVKGALAEARMPQFSSR